MPNHADSLRQMFTIAKARTPNSESAANTDILKSFKVAVAEASEV